MLTLVSKANGSGAPVIGRWSVKSSSIDQPWARVYLPYAFEGSDSSDDAYFVLQLFPARCIQELQTNTLQTSSGPLLLFIRAGLS